MTDEVKEIVEKVPSDPVVHKSLAWPLLLAALALVVSTVAAFYQEFGSRWFGLRPWKAYQARYQPLQEDFYRKLLAKQKEKVAAIKAMPEYAAMEKDLAAAQETRATDREGPSKELDETVTPAITALTKAIKNPKSLFEATRNKLDRAAKDDKARFKAKLEKIKAGPYTVNQPGPDGKSVEKTMTLPEMQALSLRMKGRKAELIGELARIDRRATELQKKMAAFIRRRLVGPTPEQVAGLLKDAEQFKAGIKQIHIAAAGWVDRCSSCHLAIEQPVLITAADMGGEGAFTSHPNPELLAIHDPEKFGCSMCHGGNGIATTSAKEAHGQYKHWLWPKYDRENYEAGCLQCHETSSQLKHANTLNQGKEIFRHRGCWACHDRDGFDSERKQLQQIDQRLRSIAKLRKRFVKSQLEAELLSEDAESSDDQIITALARVRELTLKMSGLDTEEGQLSMKRHSLFMEKKDVAPNLKEIRAKIRPEWIPVWLEAPRKFRPTTRMPQFRLDDEQRKQITAFIWKAGLDVTLKKQKPGDAKKGRKLFETRGCLACHSMAGDDGKRVGGDFAADLSRVGEKVKYDYLVRWVHNPRARSLPYCSVCKRDITKADYDKAGLPFVFDVDHANCPRCNKQMQVQNQTVMPSLRLTKAESRDIASYLVTRKKNGVQYPKLDYLKDKATRDKLAKEGEKLVRHYGCMGCHEIGGMEQVGKIGTPLTAEGSKPIERLDFGLLTTTAKRKGWYDHKGFFIRKLKDPALFDQDKFKPDPLERLRMPNFDFSTEEINAVSTFLLGSVNSQLPEKFKHKPKGPKRDILDGWAVLKKYNCIGCHQVEPGAAARPAIQKLALYKADTNLAPPDLVGQGARVDSDWLVKFLRDPSLSTRTPHRNGVRGYLEIRMPTFTLSENEIGKLVRFFNAKSAQSTPYLKEHLDPLSKAELGMARETFITKAACLSCHVKDSAGKQKAPSFLLSRQRLKPKWMKAWMVNPSALMPETQMPWDLFSRDRGAQFAPGAATPTVARVIPRSSLARAGVKAGDRIVQVAGLKTRKPGEVLEALARYEIEDGKLIQFDDEGMNSRIVERRDGDQFTIQIRRGKESKTLTVLLEKTDRWVLRAGTVPASMENYEKDHADLLVRYLMQFSEKELQYLTKKLAENLEKEKRKSGGG